jgi:AmmeMemoRadiSam system protein A
MNPYVSLVKSTVENYVKEGKAISPPPDLPEELLKKKAGVFVTIEKGKELRGCVGTYLPTKENIAKEIISNAIAAASQDFRFGPIQKEELPHLSYTVYLLSEPEPIKNIKELNPKKYGIIVKTVASPQKSGLLLPDLEDVDTIEEQISIACQKAGIDLTEEKILIYKFTVKKYKENG